MTDCPTIKIASGLVKGVPSQYNQSVTVYRGIPYAASTAGQNRWRAPKAPVPWEGVRLADKFGPVCPQLAFGPANVDSPSPSQSEDCLTVNVWTPTRSADAKLSVFVWIYGGRFISGAGSNADFEGTGLAATGVVVVTLNYRLGILGWLATPELSAEAGGQGSGNYGLLDQIAALRWVRDNIASFGGDHDEVTIGGQSAGGACTGIHLLSPVSRGLFKRVINESGFRYSRDPLLSGLAPSYRHKDRAERQGMETMKGKGATNIDELRKLPLAKLLDGNNKNDDDIWGAPPRYRPVVDGHIFPFGFEESLRRGNAADVPVLTGHNAEEGGTYLDPAFTVDDMRACAEQKYGPLADRFMELYPVSDAVTPLDAWNAAARDNSRVTVAVWADEFHQNASSPVFGYFFTQAPPAKQKAASGTAGTQAAPMPTGKVPRNVYTYMKNSPEAARGSYHGAEIPYVLNNLDAQEGYPWNETDRAVAKMMSTYWSNFIKTADPNDPDLPEFIETNSKTIMTLGQESHATPLADTPERVAFWREHLAKQKPF